MTPTDPAVAWLAGEQAARSALLDSLDDAAWLVDAASLTVLRVNAACAQFFGDQASQVVGSAAEGMLPTLEDAAFWAEVRAGGHGRLVSDTELVRPDGVAVIVQRRITPVGESAPHGPGTSLPAAPACYLVQLRDRSSERRAEQERETLVAELRATLEATADGILVTGLTGGIQAFNRRFAHLWGLPETALAERNDVAVYDWMRLHVLNPEAYQERLDEITAHSLLTATDTLALVNGALLERQTQPQWSHGRPIGRVFSFRELNRRRPGAPRDEAAPGEDALTRWPSRGGFMKALGDGVERARGSGSPLAVLCIEFDRDALYNAETGARARAIGELVEGLRACVRGPHLIARLGASRFAVLLRQAGDDAAEGLARRLLEVARGVPAGPFATEGLAAVIGIAAYPQAGLDADHLLLHAERALQQARHDGGPGWRVHRASPRDDSDRLNRLEQSVREELAANAFFLQYQPRLHTGNGRIEAVEALLRWRDPARGKTLPAQFLPLAERAGLSGALDDWAMERALRQMQQWRAAGLSLSLIVNAGAWQLSQPGFARRVAALLETARWPAASLEIDISEAALQADPEASLANIRSLRRLGVQVVLDQFGSGEVALGLLRRYPLSAVKLDRALLRGLPRRPADAAFASALIQVARAMQVQVHAVGVETEGQRQFLAQAGCESWQGLLFSPPLDARALERCVREQMMAPAANDESRGVVGVAAND